MPEYPAGTFARWKVGSLGPDAVTHVVDVCPPALAPPTTATRLPVRFVPYNGPGAGPPGDDRPAGRPRVCVVWGTSTTAMSGPRSFALPDIVTALAGLDVEVVVTATAEDLDRLGPLPRGVRGVERCPLRLVLPGCSAVVHHGGAGCTMTAVDAGVPQLGVSFAIEQALNAERVAAAGAGAHLPGHLAGVDTVRAAVTDLLDKPAYAAAARALREDARARPTPADLVSTLAGLAGRP
ncbi:hypothetical protein GCM10020358_40800 [Amorphoplanes nipponensis]|uniref:nucleotide disphospho-sugar-binding domain-containing protein n=1 Tax=Actinoplanes nipponensis TaxID=135950 RepID=UPI0031EC85DC